MPIKPIIISRDVPDLAMQVSLDGGIVQSCEVANLRR